jgi:hypothetical protein
MNNTRRGRVVYLEEVKRQLNRKIEWVEKKGEEIMG